MIVSLDISTSMTGFSLISQEGKVIHADAIDLSGIKDFVKKVEKAREVIVNEAMKHDIGIVAVEKNLQGFRRGFSSAQTLDTLARFNGALSFAVASFFNVPLFNIDVSEARRSLGIKIIKEKVCGISTKEQVKRALDDILRERGEQISWPTKVMKSGAQKGTEKLADGVYDRVDSIVIGLAYLKMFGYRS